MSTGTERVCVVVPAYDEGPAIAEVVAALRARYAWVLVVDDGSTDDTAAQARGAGAEVVRHVVNRGQGAALQTGIARALRRGASRVVTFDGDGQHRVEDVDALLAALTGGVEVALGSRFLGSAEGMPATRRLMLRLAVAFTRWTTRLAVTDTHNGLRALTADAAARIELRLDRMAHASELLDQVRRLGLSWVEVPVHLRYTAYAAAKGQRLRDAWRVLLEYLIGSALR